MPIAPVTSRKTKLDGELKRLVAIEEAASPAARQTFRLSVAVSFIMGVLIYLYLANSGVPGGIYVAIAAGIGGYMALNIGANDVANSMGPAVGSGAVTIWGALLIAVIGYTSGAYIAGGDVVGTISKGIISIDAMPDTETFIWAMMAALFAAATWVNIATMMSAPVSTTHSIVGGVMGAGIAASGWQSVDWGVMGSIAASWVISPALSGAIAALFLLVIERTVLDQKHKVAAAEKMVPLFVGFMAAAFSMYLVMKGLKRIWSPPVYVSVAIGAAALGAVWYWVRRILVHESFEVENTKKAIAALFNIPLIMAAGLLAFAGGSNDVANAIGPLAAIAAAVENGGITQSVTIPGWALLTGGIGMSFGLVLWGPKLIRTVGHEITKLNPARSFAVALSAAITVIVASGLGLPVSSTHIAVGAVFGVGFFREYLANRISGKPVKNAAKEMKPKRQKRARRRYLVRRNRVASIAAAWVITVPGSAFIAAIYYYAIRGFMLS